MKKDEYRKPPRIELAEILQQQMTREKALSILKLQGIPSPVVYEKRAQELLKEYQTLEDLSNVTKLHLALNHLRTNHQLAISDIQFAMTQADNELKAVLEPLNRRAEYSSQNLMVSIQKQLNELSKQYLQDLKTDIDHVKITNIYTATFDKILDLAKIIKDKKVERDFRSIFEKMRNRITDAYQNTDSLDERGRLLVFREEHDNYLDKIQLMIEKPEDLQNDDGDAEPLLHQQHYHIVLQALHAKLQKLGNHYFSEIAKPHPNVKLLQDEYRSGFQQAIKEAQKEPGIWVNLHPILKFLASAIFIVGIVILISEKPEDRNRLFHGKPQEEIAAQKQWQEWEMDILPDPEVSDKKIKSFKAH